MKPKIGIGFRIGKLTVSEPTGERKNGYMVWNCTCDCGGAVQLDTRTLQRGTVRDCGCETKVKPGQKDLTGRIFGKLTVLELAEWKNGTSYWHCRCECGNETIVRYVYLINGHTKSCGCLQSSIIKTNMKFVDGISVTLLEKTGKRLLKNNSSGYNGVYLNRRTQKWTAQIGFKGKNYNLGSFSRIEDAVDARKKAEDRIYGEFLEWYYQTYQKKPVHATNSSKTET